MPQAQVLPAVLDRAAADLAVRRWTKGRFLAPRAFRSAGMELPGRPLHLPVWSVDAIALTQYRGRRGRTHWETKSSSTYANGGWQNQSEQVRKIDWTRVEGRVRHRLVDVQVRAASPWDGVDPADLGPWPSTDAGPPAAVPAGLDVVPMTTDVDQAVQAALSRVEGELRRGVEDDIGGDDQDITELRTELGDVVTRLLLVPCWVATVGLGSKRYTIVVDAVHGRVVGRRPWSPVGVAGTAASAVGAVAAAVAAVRYGG